MSIYIGNNKVIDDYNEVIVGQYATRASLPSGVTGYLAYVTDQNELVINTSQTVHPNTANSPAAPVTTTNSPDSGVTWYKVLANPISSSLSPVLNQGTLAGGYNGSSVWNYIAKITFSNDATALMSQTLPWATRYSTAMSTSAYAYYHQGDYSSSGNTSTSTFPGQSAKQSWTTNTVSAISSVRPKCLEIHAVTFQSGSSVDTNTIGVMHYDAESSYFTFATDTWAYDALYDPPANSDYGLSASGANYSYVNYSSVYKFNWSTKSFGATPNGPPPSANGGTRGTHNTTWGKFYYAYLSGIDKYNESTDDWHTTVNAISGSPMSEISTITGQNWGYWFAYFNGYVPTSAKTTYATDTIAFNSNTNTPGAYGSGNSACGCTGP